MNQNTKRRSEASDRDLVVCTDWCTGPRTPAWDRLWRQILTDLAPNSPAEHTHVVSELPDSRDGGAA
jgi:hypothetical protein